jgi:hypothetical protein
MHEQTRLIDFAWLPLAQAAAYFGLPEQLLADVVLFREPSPIRARVVARGTSIMPDDWGIEVWHEDVGIWLITRREERSGVGLARQRLVTTATEVLRRP